jgi:hypothetical protein
VLGFGVLLGLCFLFRSPLPLIIGWPLLAIFGLVAFRRNGPARVNYAYLNLLDLGLLVLLYLCLAFNLALWSNVAFVLGAISVVNGLGLVVLLHCAPQLPEWLTSILPLRGLHARRLLAALGIALLLEPVLYIAARAALGQRLDTNGILSAPVGATVIVGLVFMMLPLWDVLARGWHLEGRDN